ncbi:MAG: adenylate/guanylate cyclase domain-containing protein [Leptospiraceae bacterium]|nr:adenylate/guanylate cyclase domain-containing protein [Leptospiraceae bacterium]MCK6381172.1 adenylate/guanylate cyclase domain-containing protein [Leptospiraceae bacterium]NUM40860.1 adenylate/guanylate cyclase domain-containing protein [Leptospiraceae bacterium]
MLQLLWNTIAYQGVLFARDYSEHKHIVLINGFAALVTMFTLLVFIVFQFLGSVLVIDIINVLFILFLPFTIYLNSIGKLLFARIYILTISTAYIVSIALLEGAETRSHLFLIAEGLAVFFIFPRQEKNWKIGLAFVVFCLFIFLRVSHQYFPLSIPYKVGFETQKLLMDISFAALIFVLAIYINSIFQKSELSIQLEREKSEKLLLNILPASIAKKLRENTDTIADRFENCTVLFSDIVGFSELSKIMSADGVVKLLNDIFSSFDDLVEKYGLEKIKTIGDAYMVVGGLPEPDENHAEKIANLALEMLEIVKEYSEKNKLNLDIRIGINSGHAVAGVIGKKKFIYDLWGDSVNTASRMESHGVPGKIQISNSTYFLIKDKFQFKDRGTVEVKGIGKIQSYLLLEKSIA